MARLYGKKGREERLQQECPDRCSIIGLVHGADFWYRFSVRSGHPWSAMTIFRTVCNDIFSFPLRCFFYLVTPGETTFESPDDVPDVISMIIPYFVVMIAVEATVCQFKGTDPSIARTPRRLRFAPYGTDRTSWSKFESTDPC